jgi:hypothetical protein
VPDELRASASPLYAMGQLRRAIDSMLAARNPDDRARLEAKAARWRAVLDGMAGGTLSVGSRTPVAGAPAWVTLEVAHGGFASGRFLAEMPLLPAEHFIVDQLDGDVSGSSSRERLNLWFLTDAGQAALTSALADRRYRVEVPEDAALLAVAWLLDHGGYEAALDLVSELRPWMHRLRFAALTREAAPSPKARVHVQTAGQAASALRTRKPRTQVAVMAETLQVWQPLFDRLLSLWCETVDGGLPHLETQQPAGQAVVTGGWPCRCWPADWAERRRAWLVDYANAARDCQLGSRHLSPKSNFARLRQALDRCDTDSSDLTSRDVGWIRRAIANTVSRHGAPGSPARTELHSAQAHIVCRPLHADLARVLAARLDRFPADGGIPSVDSIAGEVQQAESAEVPAGHAIPAYLIAKASRALDAPAEELIDRGIIGSADVLADLLPQISAQVLAAGFDDSELRALYAQAYAAFRRRRSLLLLNLEHQVRFEELPWIAAIEPARSNGADAQAAARQALKQVTVLALTGFPHAILPNPLIAEMAALAKQAGMQVPLVEEVAADIFMGTFTEKWRHAAAAASSSLHGTLYARYYDLPEPGTWTTPRAKRAAQGSQRRWGKKTAEDFTALCAARAAAETQAPSSRSSRVAANGTILEQAQILTTHNLAALVDALDLGTQLTALSPELAGRALAWAVSQLRHQPDNWHASLRAVKNAAYAWRQAIYYLSFCDQNAQQGALATLERQVQAAGDDLSARIGPAVDGLAFVIAGERFGPSGSAPPPGQGRRLVGWATGPHWVLSSASLPAKA